MLLLLINNFIYDLIFSYSMSENEDTLEKIITKPSRIHILKRLCTGVRLIRELPSDKMSESEKVEELGDYISKYSDRLERFYVPLLKTGKTHSNNQIEQNYMDGILNSINNFLNFSQRLKQEDLTSTSIISDIESHGNNIYSKYLEFLNYFKEPKPI